MRFSHAATACLVAAAVASFQGCNQSDAPKQSPPDSARQARPATEPLFTARMKERTGQDFSMLVETGDPTTAESYNKEIERQLGIGTRDTLDQVLAFCGYSGVTGRDIETTAPADFAARFGPDVTGVRFFAPKIIDVSKPGSDLGWREVVRLKVKPGSPAAAKNVDAMYLLFNVFQPIKEIAEDPFLPCNSNIDRCSPNNQVMLTIANAGAGTPTAFWLVFDTAAVEGGKRTDHLKATFDGGDQASTTSGNAVKAYYVPDACAQCHGGSQATAKLNLLDSDHWNDRVQSGDDFPMVAAAGHGVLFDGGQDTTTPAFKDVFGTLRALNIEIRNQIAKSGGEDFQLRAAEAWLNLHQTSVKFEPPVARGLPPTTAGGPAWKNTPEDAELLGLLNRYCYRCHSSVAYHVFDKETVFRKRNRMATLIERTPAKPGGMPQDRVLPAPVVADLVKRLRGMQ